MKGNKDQELMQSTLNSELMRKLLTGKTLGQQTSPKNSPITRESLETLLKSLYYNNAQKKGNYNIKNVNNLPNEKVQTKTVFEEFSTQDPTFFEQRNTLLDYLKNSNVNFDLEELIKIAQLAKQLEQEAIKRFCAKNQKYADFLEQENRNTLNKLEGTANSGFEGSIQNKPYFDAQSVGKMTSEEFLKNQEAIDAQIMDFLRNK